MINKANDDVEKEFKANKEFHQLMELEKKRMLK